jgi:molybdate transport system substrate-binding protein
MKKSYLVLSIILVLLMVSGSVLAGCTNTSTTSTTLSTTTSMTPTSTSSTTLRAVALNVSAASSLTDALKEINALYTKENPNITITPNFASSGTLQKQIEQGAPADVFISAGASQMDALQKENLIVTTTRKNLLNNTLVMIVPNDSTLGLTNFKDLAGDNVKKIAIGDPKSVPAGSYAQMAFDELGITAQVTGKYVIGADVKGVLSYVESGNVDAGLVYSTDAKTSTKVKVVANAPADINAKIVYPAAVVAASKVAKAATNYENFLFGTEAKTIFEKWGFTMAGK